VHSPQRVGSSPVTYTGHFRPNPTSPARSSRRRGWTSHGPTPISSPAEPGGNTGPGNAQVRPALRPTLVAAFNSGWKMKDIAGGFYANSRTAVPLRDGAASLVIEHRRPGHDRAVETRRHDEPPDRRRRQNLHLIIDGGPPVAGLTDNSSGAWGSAKNQFQYTWRSGVGTDRAGNLIYVGGDKLTLAGLAQAMVKAGHSAAWSWTSIPAWSRSTSSTRLRAHRSGSPPRS